MNQLGIFAKYWQPGAVKTRLAATLGPEPASQLYRLFVKTLLSRFARQADRRILAYTPADRRQEFARLSGPRWELVAQQPGDLGERMQHFFGYALENEADRVVLIGSDSPALPQVYLDEAFRMLESHPVVLGPSEDGGYYLIGARAQVPGIFSGVTWSTPSVWEQTVTLLKRSGASFAVLPQWYDVDEAEDLRRLHGDLNRMNESGEVWLELRAAVRAALPG